MTLNRSGLLNLVDYLAWPPGHDFLADFIVDHRHVIMVPPLQMTKAGVKLTELQLQAIPDYSRKSLRQYISSTEESQRQSRAVAR
jgi:hypothetical protein